MALGVAWKLFSDDFLNSSFFTYSLLADSRFEKVAVWIGGMSPAALLENRQALEALKTSFLEARELSSVTLHSTAAVAMLANALTIWTLLIESVVTAAFLAPSSKFVDLCRNTSLTIFIGTTYIVTPVVGFGWILTLLGIAQCSATSTRWPLIYLFTFLLSCLTRVLFEGVVGILLD
jgi:hypothetical protein